MADMNAALRTRYACAVLLIASSIALAFLQALRIDDVADGVLIYIAQAFMLAGSIFGLDYYLKKLMYGSKDGNTPEGTSEQ